MLRGPLLGGIITYTIPIILTSILQLLFNAADLVVVGRYCGSISVAAVGATGSITALIVNLFVGLSVGAGVTVAHGVGSREDAVVHRTVHTAIPMALVSGVVLTVVGVLFSGTFLEWMGTPENVMKLSTVYMRIYFAGITFTMVYNFAASILRAVGDTKSPLIFLTIAGVINVVLNVFFVTRLHMNVAGVALATTISQGVSAAAMVIVLMRRTDAARLCLKKLRFYMPQMLKMIRIGLPAGVQSSLFSISNVLIQSSVNSFGDVLMSGNAASQNLESFLYASMNSFHQTAVNYIGQNVGAKQYDRVKRIVWICLGSVAVLGLAMGTGMCVFGEHLLGIYITDSQEAISWGLIRLYIICQAYFICGLMDVSTGALRGMGASISPMIISVLGVCGIRIGWIMTIFKLPRFHTPQSLYYSYIFSWTVTFLIQICAFVIVYRRHRQRLNSGKTLH
ncbi:MAG: MATE family efflux transporter [Oscillospiraceae bacterium]|nr:MATE family efflux transporter [Oscillospiraceae bacterium]MBR6595141.1 MATE family efflux transporter [Oscillospiraceae bacterium]